MYQFLTSKIRHTESLKGVYDRRQVISGSNSMRFLSRKCR